MLLAQSGETLDETGAQAPRPPFPGTFSCLVVPGWSRESRLYYTPTDKGQKSAHDCLGWLIFPALNQDRSKRAIASCRGGHNLWYVTSSSKKLELCVYGCIFRSRAGGAQYRRRLDLARYQPAGGTRVPSWPDRTLRSGQVSLSSGLGRFGRYMATFLFIFCERETAVSFRMKTHSF